MITADAAVLSLCLTAIISYRVTLCFVGMSKNFQKPRTFFAVVGVVFLGLNAFLCVPMVKLYAVV